MSYATFFEIGGHVVESYIEDLDGVPSKPPSSNLLIETGKKYGVPASLTKKASREIKRETHVDLIKLGNVPGRANRARWALTTAFTLAAADGPVLPFGDMAAAGFLTVYGLYETGKLLGDLKEGVGF